MGSHGGREEDDEAVRFGEGGELGAFEVYLRGAGTDCETLRQIQGEGMAWRSDVQWLATIRAGFAATFAGL